MAIIYLGVGWFLGLWLASLIDVPAGIGLLLAAAGLVGAWLGRTRPAAAYLLLTLCALGGGGYRYQRALPHIDAGHVAYYNDSAEVSLIGLVGDEPRVYDRYVDLVVEIEQLVPTGEAPRPVRGKALVRTQRFPVVDYGSRVELTGRLETPAADADFDYPAYLARNGVYAVSDFPRLRVLAAGQGNWLRHGILSLKARARLTIARIIPEPEAALLTGILLGDDSGMAGELVTAFEVTQLSHIIAISGFNVAILTGVMLRLSQALLPRWAAVAVTLAGIALYTVLVGAGASVVRAAIMGGIYLFTTRQLGRPAYAFASLFVAGMLMTLFNPLLLWDAGFQLSFAATLGLMLYTNRLSQWTRQRLCWLNDQRTRNQVMRVLNESFLATIAAQILTWPLCIALFGQLSLVSLPANLFILPAQPGVMMWGGIATLAGMSLPAAGQLLGYVAWLFLAYTTQLVETFAVLPNVSIPAEMGVPGLAAYYGLITAGTWWFGQDAEQRAGWRAALRPHLPWHQVAGAALVAAILVVAWGVTQPDGRLHVTFLDVGQGDATFIQTPSGRQILVDGGLYPTLLNQRLGRQMPFWDKTVDIVVATHADADHVAGLTGVFERYRVGRLVSNGQKSGVTNAYDQVLQAAKASETEIHAASAGEVMAIGDGVTLEVLHPASWLPADNRNDNSLCLRLRYGDFTLLLTGDAEAGAERDMVASGRPLASQIFKAGHHGSRSSSNDFFLQAVQPRFVVISAGQDNQFDHPHPEVLARARAAGAAVLRTDELGTIEVISDGQSMWWEAR